MKLAAAKAALFPGKLTPLRQLSLAGGDGDESSLLLRVQVPVVFFPIPGATSMCSLPVFVGLDYHDSSVRVCVLDTDGSELANAD